MTVETPHTQNVSILASVAAIVVLCGWGTSTRKQRAQHVWCVVPPCSAVFMGNTAVHAEPLAPRHEVWASQLGEYLAALQPTVHGAIADMKRRVARRASVHAEPSVRTYLLAKAAHELDHMDVDPHQLASWVGSLVGDALVVEPTLHVTNGGGSRNINTVLATAPAPPASRTTRTRHVVARAKSARGATPSSGPAARHPFQGQHVAFMELANQVLLLALSQHIRVGGGQVDAAAAAASTEPLVTWRGESLPPTTKEWYLWDVQRRQWAWMPAATATARGYRIQDHADPAIIELPAGFLAHPSSSKALLRASQVDATHIRVVEEASEGAAPSSSARRTAFGSVRTTAKWKTVAHVAPASRLQLQRFTSTSTDRSVAQRFAARTSAKCRSSQCRTNIWKVHITPGTCVVPIHAIGSAYDREDQAEVLLPPTTVLEVMRHDGNVTQVRTVPSAAGDVPLVDIASPDFKVVVEWLLVVHFLMQRIAHFMTWNGHNMVNVFFTTALEVMYDEYLCTTSSGCRETYQQRVASATQAAQRLLQQAHRRIHEDKAQ